MSKRQRRDDVLVEARKRLGDSKSQMKSKLKELEKRQPVPETQ
jgi:hypothetical protein